MKRLKPLVEPGRVVTYLDSDGDLKRHRTTRLVGHGQQLARRRLEAGAEWQAGFYGMARQIRITRQQLRAYGRRLAKQDEPGPHHRSDKLPPGNRAQRRARAADVRSGLAQAA